ncbi:MAG TPA: Gfo/Idh/MocA family oxidoreductase [Candidatus Ruania gallistercoris]|uniref:Gfo/Idh/MocA family oxidoreductase n=1 Tax=Candidatus Ruania gallistercoris TaxID=2838746 RepID=A0A9D2EE86_9MICO|nr:Gfo/Idh/MocA family oxidoreductase [Candidatus Ruania gallistercoris]
MSTGLNIAVVGLGFGEAFVPIYQAHPEVNQIALVDISTERLARVGDLYGVADRFTSYEDMLADPTWDAVHILAPVAFHANYTLAALRAGKHVACAVPMATDLADIDEILEAQAASGMQYMMMETSVYQREFRAVENMYRAGTLGELTLYKGVHIQNLDGYPPYWLGFPPMQYITHALSPALKLTGTGVQDVVAYGSGRLDAARVGESGNIFPTEVGLFRLNGHDLVPEVTMSFFKTARPYIEGFSAYGSKASVEWPVVEKESPLLYELQDLDPNQADTGLRGRRSHTGELEVDNGTELLPEPLQRFVDSYQVQPADGGPTVWRSAEHGGSHPHLVHEFISAITTGRTPEVGPVTAAEWTAAGICAHESAMAGGERVVVPQYRSSSR